MLEAEMSIFDVYYQHWEIESNNLRKRRWCADRLCECLHGGYWMTEDISSSTELTLVFDDIHCTLFREYTRYGNSCAIEETPDTIHCRAVRRVMEASSQIDPDLIWDLDTSELRNVEALLLA